MQESKESSRSAWYWTAVLVPAVMAGWAVFQLWMVHTQGLNSWRGGGFGMYAGFHPVQNDAWLRIDDQEPIHFTKSEKSDHPLYRVVRPHLTFPRETELAERLKTLGKENGHRYHVVITQLAFDLDSGQLSRTDLLRCGESSLVEDQP